MRYVGSRWQDKLLLFYVRKIPNHPFKIRILNWFNTAVYGDEIKVTSENGTRLFLSAIEQMGCEIIFTGAFEPYTLTKCEELLKNGGNCIDIGANMGLYSIYLSKINNVSIYAIEPSAHNFQKLLNHINLNKAQNIHPINVGLSYEDSFGYLVNLSPNNSGTVKVDDQNSGSGSYLIRLCTLADLIRHLKLINIELIKIDVEGFEMNIFNGFFGEAQHIMPQNIIMEFTDQIERTGYTMADCYDYFMKLGYEAFTVTGEVYNLGGPLPEANLWLKLAV
jgi:FkbM family methyltransferase